MCLPFLCCGALEERHVPFGYGLPFCQPEDHDGEDEDGVFPEAAGTAQLEGKAFLGKGDERCAVRGAHIQQAVRERTEAEAVDEGRWQWSEKIVERQEPQDEPPAEPV